MNTTRFLLAISMLCAACDGDEAKSKAAADGGEAKTEQADGAAASKVDYSEVDAKIAAAKTGDQWLEVVTACGSLEIDAAMNGNQKLAEDPEFNEHCGTNVQFKRAEQAIELSTPDKMHDTCISAAMGLEGLIEEGKEVDKAKATLAKVNEACGM